MHFKGTAVGVWPAPTKTRNLWSSHAAQPLQIAATTVSANVTLPIDDVVSGERKYKHVVEINGNKQIEA